MGRFARSSKIKLAWKVLVGASLLSYNLAMALDDKTADSDPAAPPPIPPKVQGDELEPSVVITEREGERIEEYSLNGRTYMIKITPLKGPAYYYIDEDGDGRLELSETDRRLNPVRPVYWKVKEW